MPGRAWWASQVTSPAEASGKTAMKTTFKDQAPNTNRVSLLFCTLDVCKMCTDIHYEIGNTLRLALARSALARTDGEVADPNRRQEDI